MKLTFGFLIIIQALQLSAQVTRSELNNPLEQIENIIIIVHENRSAIHVYGNPELSYINDLMRLGAYAASYYNFLPVIHPSLPNYILMVSGDTKGIIDSGPPAAHIAEGQDNLMFQLDQKNISWKGYFEGINGTGCPAEDNEETLYAVRHNPFVYFSYVLQDEKYCEKRIRPFEELWGDLDNYRLPRFTFIVPNNCNNGHGVVGYECTMANLDNWTKEIVEKIKNSPVYSRGKTAIFILWEEPLEDNGPVPFIVVSPLVKSPGYANAILYTHCSLLRTVQEVFGLRPFLGCAENAADLRDFFQSFQPKERVYRQ